MCMCLNLWAWRKTAMHVHVFLCIYICGGKGAGQSEVGQRGLSPGSSGLVLQGEEREEEGYLQ